MRDLPVASIEDVERALQAHHYVADRSLATTLFLALTLDKPLLLEGEAGVGKTEVGKVLAEILDTTLIRLQCYEGIDVNTAVYEWAYAKQMLHIRLLESAGAQRDETERECSSFIGGVRRLDLYKLPGIAETLDWTRSLIALGETELSEAAVQATLGAVVKYQEDLERLRGAGSRELLARAVNA